MHREHFKRRLVRDWTVSNPAEPSTLLTRSPLASPPGVSHRCSLCTFLPTSQLSFSQRRVLRHSPLPLGTPSAVRRVRVVEKLACLVCHQPIAARSSQHRRCSRRFSHRDQHRYAAAHPSHCGSTNSSVSSFRLCAISTIRASFFPRPHSTFWYDETQCNRCEWGAAVRSRPSEDPLAHRPRAPRRD
ncbi:hypothetical protein ABB37_06591 [Leptomonas pyrrhocoris]|uniref:Uncharacterized protein n=1 Tax=Leptomonas pyrrhocoris TaxID=157538 RepID=A0A0N0DTN4_LEPPY|nr:hypothetical protein ABB37_09348 [Leptomonas pyrrhocoris]XP_015656181.1 hypothetical protein ABB37_06591 [Leptomonas pyrrhocoris]KPA74036.1 hypothetical protein ABB37_09348 [Leptomonas pyrrhocoris]KPA77742.1 hypothetical protein ABB37_06591 [Leptomonas pyrrhocoris]|eukprot:XP_015652475.1 hypothetical protein ABB37_09348 [Leptomonas pyrrhocoris]